MHISLTLAIAIVCNKLQSHFAQVTSSNGSVDCTSAHSPDYGKTACANSQGIYYNGTCFKMYTATYGACVAYCAAMGGKLMTVTSADMGEAMINSFLAVNPWALGYPLNYWIPSTPADQMIYSQIQNTKSIDGKYVIQNAFGTPPCVVLHYDPAIPSVINLMETMDCTRVLTSFCQTLPIFNQTGCEQALTRGPCITTFNTTTAKDCAVKCAINTWCASFNYDTVTQVCEISPDNTKTQTLACEANWLYYERV